MGATYSSNGDLHSVVRDAVVSSRRMLIWSKPEEMANVVDNILEEMDLKKTGIITKPGFFKAAALLDLETRIEVLEDVFKRLDPEENGFVERSLLQHLATTRVGNFGPESAAQNDGTGKVPPMGQNRRRRTSLPPAFSLEEGRFPESWRDILLDFESHAKGRQLRKTLNKHPFAQWQIRSDAWEEKLERAQERKLQLHKGIYPPLACKPEHFRPESLRVMRAGGVADTSGRRIIPSKKRTTLAKKSPGKVSFSIASPTPTGTRRTQYLESVAKDTTLDELQSITQFSASDLQKLRERFYDEALASALTVERFCAFLTKEYPQLEGHQALLLRLFALFDTDSNGTVDFKELIMGMVKTLNSGVEDKISLLFACIDLSADGNINLQELTHVIAKNQGDLKASIDYARDFFSHLDTDQSGRISLDEFKKSLQMHPKLYKSLLRALPLPTTAFDVMEEIQSSQRQSSVAFSLENLKQVYKEYSVLHKRTKNGSKASRSMTRKVFRRIMGKHFGLQRLDQQKLLDRLFDAFDTDHSGSVSLEEILRGISLLIATKNKNGESAQQKSSAEACLDFYLDLIDNDGTPGGLGSMRLNEDLRSVLQRSESRLRAEFKQSKTLIEELAKSSETISSQDLLKLSQQHPELLNVLRQNLMR